MFKNLIAPVQAWLLTSGKCVGCGSSIADGQTEKTTKSNVATKVTCKCGRVYLMDPSTKKYRRALLSEI